MTEALQTLAENYLQSRSEKDFKLLYNRILPGIKKYIWSFIQDYHSSGYDLINEIVSATFIKVLSKIDQYNPVWNFSTWVYRIARNEALMEINRLKKLVFIKYNSDSTEFEDFLSLENILNRENYIEEINIEIQDEIKAKVEFYEKTVEEIFNLKPMHKDILVDRELNNMKYEEIAEKYRLPLNTVKSRIRCGREKVRNTINRANIKNKE